MKHYTEQEIRDNFDGVVASKSENVPTELGLDIKTCAALYLYKLEPTNENLEFAKGALDEQFTSDPIQDVIDRRTRR